MSTVDDGFEFQTMNIGKSSIRIVHYRNSAAVRPVPLLLCNGLGVTLEVVLPFMRLMPAIESIAFDVPGIGGSEPPRTLLRFRKLARLLNQLLDELGYQTADVLGVSWGGALAQEFAYRYPNRCRRLVLAATTAGMVMAPGKLSVLKEMAHPRRYLEPGYLRKVANTIYGGSAKDSEEAMAVMLKSGKVTNRGYFQQLFAGVGWTSYFWLPKVRQPALILSAVDDPIIRPVNARILHQRLPNSRLEMVEGGHLFLLTHAKENSARIAEFLGQGQEPMQDLHKESSGQKTAN